MSDNLKYQATAERFDFNCNVCYDDLAHIIAYIAKKLLQFLLDDVAEAWRWVIGNDIDRRPFARKPPGQVGVLFSPSLQPALGAYVGRVQKGGCSDATHNRFTLQVPLCAE